MRIGVHLGPFWASTSTRRRRRPTQAQIAQAEQQRREAEAAAKLRRVDRMTPEDARREAEADPEYRDWLQRRAAGIDADLERLKGDVTEGPEA
jgi:hypothetical protein